MNKEQKLRLLHRELAASESRDSLVKFARFMMPDPVAPDDMTKSLYQVERHHRVICKALEKVESGEWKRLMISLPPRAGKSLLASQMFPSWFVGRDPTRSVIMTSYNEIMAREFGRAVKHIMQQPLYNQVFPEAELRKSAASTDRIQTDLGGTLFAVGRGSALTGRGADVLLIDDPLKDRVEADSIVIRDRLWNWYTQVALTRLMTDEGRVVIIQTRWHTDDLIGRIIDPTNDYFITEEADQWKVLNIPAIAGVKDPLGRKPGQPLWPSRFSKQYLLDLKRQDPRGFEALYQGNPTPADGLLFTTDNIPGYKLEQQPTDELRIYMAADFAVSTKESADKTCIIIFGIDKNGITWVLPRIFWQRANSEKIIDGLLDLMNEYRPTMAFFERGHISLSLGPALRRRMQERNIYCAIREIHPSKDKVTRAQAIANRMALGKVMFPMFTSWFNDAKTELLQFPSGQHDDFVDAMSLIGSALDTIAPGISPIVRKDAPATGTLAWVKASSAEEQRASKLIEMSGGW